MKRFGFEEKMDIAQMHSRNSMSPSGTATAEQLAKSVSPWELETFTMLAIAAREWKSDSFQGDNIRIFYKIIQCIRDYIHPVLEDKEGLEFAEYFMLSTSATQFDIQEYYPFKLYRYYYYFTFVNEHVNMPQLFNNRFGCDYWDFILFAYTLWFFFCSDKPFPWKVFRQLSDQYPVVLKNLSISRSEYINRLNDITKCISDYMYCLRPSYIYPFIIDKDHVFIPLPHLILRAASSSLLYRLTDNNNVLAETIGKEVFESYLFKIVQECGQFNEVIPEMNYTAGRLKKRTIDVMTRSDNNYVFFDSKSFAPKSDLRIFSESSMINDQERLVESMNQMYQHIHNRFPSEYNFFTQCGEVHLNNIYGLIVLKDNPNFLPEKLYQKAADIIGIQCNTDDYYWLCTHIGLVSIYDVERYCFTSSSIIEAIQANIESGRIYDFWLNTQLNNTSITSEAVLTFKQMIVDSSKLIAKDILLSGIHVGKPD